MRWIRLVGLLAGVALCPAPGAAAEAEDEASVVSEILDVLRERGLLGEDEHRRLLTRNARWEAERQQRAPRMRWSGDFRIRHESLWFHDDEASRSARDDRYRLRYRLRIRGEVDLGEAAAVVLRVVSGDLEARSANQTLGSGVDFDTDDLRLDMAYARLRAPAEHLPARSEAVLEIGKVPNPFRWEVGQDMMLWDGDITLEGASLRLEAEPAAGTRAFARAGYYLVEENAEAKDPHLWAVQVGAHHDVHRDWRVGARASWYDWRSLDADFAARGATGSPSASQGGGNLVDGLTGRPGGRALGVAEAAAYLTWSGLERWPITVYGDWARNLDAERSRLFPAARAEDTAWGVGVEVGSRSEVVLLGAGYWDIEANAWPSMFVDSNLFDGLTNRRGLAFYAARRILTHAEVQVRAFVSDEIEDALPAFSASVPGAERVRLQADLSFQF